VYKLSQSDHCSTAKCTTNAQHEFAKHIFKTFEFCFIFHAERIPRTPNGQTRNTSMISNVEVPSADPAEQPRIVAAAVRTHKSASQIHEAAPAAAEEELDQFVVLHFIKSRTEFLLHGQHTMM
jgi:hypothetical protein